LFGFLADQSLIKQSDKDLHFLHAHVKTIVAFLILAILNASFGFLILLASIATKPYSARGVMVSTLLHIMQIVSIIVALIFNTIILNDEHVDQGFKGALWGPTFSVLSLLVSIYIAGAPCLSESRRGASLSSKGFGSFGSGISRSSFPL